MVRDKRTIANTSVEEIRKILLDNETEEENRRLKVQLKKIIMNCPICKTDYEQTREWQKFCSPRCAYIWRQAYKKYRRAAK